jgi:hypothetical protein
MPRPHAHLVLVTSEETPAPAAAPQAAGLPESVATFLAAQTPELRTWLRDSDHDVAVRIRRLAGDLFLVGRDEAPAQQTAERLMLCVEMAVARGLHAQGSFTAIDHAAFTLVSLTLQEQTWLEQSSSERAVHLRALQASASIGADETILVQFAAGLRVARNAGAITLDDLLAERLAP